MGAWLIGHGNEAWERTVAKIFGGQRRGADYGGRQGGKNDVIHPVWSIECKLLTRPSFSDLSAACAQAEAAAEPSQIPIAVVKRKHDRWQDAVVVMRLDKFREWYI